MPTDEFYLTYVSDFLITMAAPDGDSEESLYLTLLFNTVTAPIGTTHFKSQTPAIKKWEMLFHALVSEGQEESRTVAWKMSEPAFYPLQVPIFTRSRNFTEKPRVSDFLKILEDMGDT